MSFRERLTTLKLHGMAEAFEDIANTKGGAAMDVAKRTKRRSTRLTSQPEVKVWHDAFSHPTFADAVLDRLVHNALENVYLAPIPWHHF